MCRCMFLISRLSSRWCVVYGPAAGVAPARVAHTFFYESSLAIVQSQAAAQFSCCRPSSWLFCLIGVANFERATPEALCIGTSTGRGSSGVGQTNNAQCCVPAESVWLQHYSLPLCRACLMRCEAWRTLLGCASRDSHWMIIHLLHYRSLAARQWWSACAVSIQLYFCRSVAAGHRRGHHAHSIHCLLALGDGRAELLDSRAWRDH
jgi:hypothetical protein